MVGEARAITTGRPKVSVVVASHNARASVEEGWITAVARAIHRYTTQEILRSLGRLEATVSAWDAIRGRACLQLFCTEASALHRPIPGDSARTLASNHTAGPDQAEKSDETLDLTSYSGAVCREFG